MQRTTRKLCAWFAAATCGMGCVDTGSTTIESLSLCVAPEPAPTPWNSVVMVNSDLREAGSIHCSGVVIAPTLVLTTLLCVALPPNLDSIDLDDVGQGLTGGFKRYYMGDVDYLGTCRADDGGWAPREDGSFSARLGEMLDPSAVTVAIEEGGEAIATSSVSRMVLPHTDSRCWDTLAVLVLDHDLGLRPATLRLEETSLVGDSVTMSGFGVADNSFTRHELPSTIETVTFEAGDATAPPRSLLLAGPVCDFETGGPVVADDSRAVIGTIGFQTDFSCEDPAASTVATRLAPFRRLLIDAADSASETLQIEPPLMVQDSPLPACP